MGIQTLPKPKARPAQGPLPVAMVSVILLVLGSMRVRLSFGLFEIQTDSSIAIQSGAPGMSKVASGFNRLMGICTPGVLTPVFCGGDEATLGAGCMPSTSAPIVTSARQETVSLTGK